MSTEVVGVLPMLSSLLAAFTGSALFTVLKWFLMLYTVVIVIDVILLVLLRGVTANLKTQLYGTERPLISKSKVAKRWEKIVARLASGNLSQYKVAVLEADHLADELLAGSGYAGANMSERLSHIHPGQLESYEDLVAAHATRNRIVNEPKFSLTREETESFLEAYRKFFVELELF